MTNKTLFSLLLTTLATLLWPFFAISQPATLSQPDCYWVFLTDKAGTIFDPYTYFDAKAIERYTNNHADLYDSTNYPLNQDYVLQVNALSTEEIGQSRWLNAVAVSATPYQAERLRQLPFVKKLVSLSSTMDLAQSDHHEYSEHPDLSNVSITPQLERMDGKLFRDRGIDGSGVRIAVFDGGFHGVNTHQAFKHLRDNNRIVATWDFTKKQENVYDNHTHGTMVLSCITGLMGDRLLGLATGATFLLAKTEVEPEPFKEEVWWLQAVEWADKNGADLINSSLGYTKDRHYTWEMDGRSYVSQAANIAARKGMVVCNSAGNSGADDNWKIIGAPADADSIISVGGIVPSLSSYEHISFSSYGPTADRRLKPNVCNFGQAECADAYNDTATKFAFGTSFSAPLTTGFVACVLQLLRDSKPTAMEVKRLIEYSGDLYPYYDYAFGYGVPQASYFVDSTADSFQRRHKATFRIEDRKAFILITPTGVKYSKRKSRLDLSGKTPLQTVSQSEKDVVLIKVQDSKGRIEEYLNMAIDSFEEPLCIAISKASIGGYTLVVHINGYTESYSLTRKEKDYYMLHGEPFQCHVIDTAGYYQSGYTLLSDRTMEDNMVSNWGVGQKYSLEYYLQMSGGGFIWCDDDDIYGGISAHIGLRLLRNFRKWYALGIGFDCGVQSILYQKDSLNVWDNIIGLPPSDYFRHKTYDLVLNDIELFQRIRLKTGGLLKKGLHWDLGIYGGIQTKRYSVSYNGDQNPNFGQQDNTYNDVPITSNNINWGFTTRIIYDFAGFYARLRMSQPELSIPRFEIGVQFSF